MKSIRRSAGSSSATWLLLVVLSHPIIATAQVTAPLQPLPAVWRTQTIDFRFRTERQHFRCEEIAARLIRIVSALGAHLHGRTQLRCTDGFGTGVSGDLVITSPVEATSENLQGVLSDITAAEKLAARVNRKPDPGTQIRVFPALWTQVSLKQSKLDTADCELLRAVEKQLLPVLMLRNAQVSATCSAHKVPTLNAVALVRIDGAIADGIPQPSPAGTVAADCTHRDTNLDCDDADDEAIDPVVLPAG